MRYKAFVSYSHSHRELARALQNSLHRFGTPWYERVGAKIFRDESGLAPSPDLWEVLRAALDESEYFVFLASPESVHSSWVVREVDHWLAHRDPDHIILVLAAGSLQWDPLAGAFDPQRTDALPEPLRKAFSRAPLYVDFREVVGTGYRLSDPLFRDRVAGIAAALHGKSKDELYGMQVSALIMSDAERMAAGAEVALGERLADRALLLGVHALRLTEAHGEARVPGAEAALRRAMLSTGGRPLGLVDNRARPPFAMSEDGRWLCTVHADGTRVWDLSGAGHEHFEPAALCQLSTPGWLQLSTDGSWLVAVKNPSREEPGKLDLWRLGTGRLGPQAPEVVPLDLNGALHFAEASLDGRYVAVSLAQPARLLVWRLPTRAEAEVDAASASPALVLSHEPSTPAWFSFASSGAILASVDGHEVRVWNLQSPDPRASCAVIDEGASIDTCKVSPAGDTLLLLVNQTPRIRRISHPEPRPPIDLTQAHELIHRLDMSPDGRWGLLLSDSGPSYLVDLRHPDPASTVLAITSINGTMNRYAFSQDGSWLATAAGPMDKYPELQVHEPEYTVRLHDLGSPARPQEIELKGHEDLVTNIAFSPDGRRLATCSLDRTVRLWDLTELDGLAKVRARLLAEPRDRDALIRTFGFDADNFEHDLERTLESLPGLIDKAASRLRERPQLLLGDDAMIQGCELSSDGAWLVASGQPDEHRACARLWRTGALTSCAAPVRLSREARIDNFQLNQTMAISPDQRWLLILEDCSLWELRPASEVIPVRLRQRGSFSAQVARFSNAGDLLVLSVDKAVIMVRIDEEGSSSPPRVLDTGGQDTRFGYFIPGDRWFVAACGGNVVGEPMDLRLWRAHEIDESGGPLILLEDARQLGECKVSPGGRWLTAWNHDAGHLWDLHHDDPRQAKRTLRGHQSKINAALFSPDERFLVSAGDDGQLLAWDLLRSESAIEPRVLHADAAPLASVVADWQRRRLFVGGNTGRATILTLDSELAAIETRELAALSGPVYAVFHPAGRSLAARDKQGVRIVDLATGAQGAVLADEPGGLQLRRQLDYSPDGRWLIVARQGRIFLIDAQPGAQAEPIELLGHHHEQIEFRGTRDSHWLVTIDRPIDEPQGYQPVQTCRIWDLQSPAPAAASVALPDLPRGVDRIAITDDDRWLVTSSRDGLRLWPLGTQHLIDLAGRSIGREPSDEERRRYAFTAAALQGIE